MSFIFIWSLSPLSLLSTVSIENIDLSCWKIKVNVNINIGRSNLFYIALNFILYKPIYEINRSFIELFFLDDESMFLPVLYFSELSSILCTVIVIDWGKLRLSLCQILKIRRIILDYESLSINNVKHRQFDWT